MALLCSMPGGAFSLSDLFFTLATKEEGRDRQLVLSILIDKLRLQPSSLQGGGGAGGDAAVAGAAGPSAPPPAAVALSDDVSPPPPPTGALNPSVALLQASRQLLLLLNRDAASREVAASQLGLVEMLLSLLEV